MERGYLRSAIEDDSFRRANSYTLLFVQPLALGALFRIYYIDVFTFGDRVVRALRFAGTAVDALVVNDDGHFYSFSIYTEI